METDINVNVVLIGKSWGKLDVLFETVSIEHISTQKLADIMLISNELSVKLCCLTDGISSLIEEYNPELTFEKNLKLFLNVNSKYYQLALNWLKECFRTPEMRGQNKKFTYSLVRKYLSLFLVNIFI